MPVTVRTAKFSENLGCYEEGLAKKKKKKRRIILPTNVIQ